MRKAELNRKTLETEITASIQLDGAGYAEVETGVGFLDHMLVLLARHAGLDLSIKAKGDLMVDVHHTIEDVGIVLGQVIARALGGKKGIQRYGHITLPMDEALVSAAVDISGRPFLVFKVQLASPMIGDFDTQMTEEFFRALAYNAGLTLHLECHYGTNDHHIVEGLFKAFARAFKQACTIDPLLGGAVPSSKGVL